MDIELRYDGELNCFNQNVSSVIKSLPDLPEGILNKFLRYFTIFDMLFDI